MPFQKGRRRGIEQGADEVSVFGNKDDGFCLGDGAIAHTTQCAQRNNCSLPHYKLPCLHPCPATQTHIPTVQLAELKSATGTFMHRILVCTLNYRIKFTREYLLHLIMSKMSKKCSQYCHFRHFGAALRPKRANAGGVRQS